MRKILTPVALAAVLVGCSGTKLQEAKLVTPQTDQHSQALYGGYLQLSESEYNQGDYKDSDHFAELAIRAGSGEKFEPQQISDRNLPTDHLNDAAAARRMLIVALYNGAAQKHPTLAAQAQVNFDCWMEQQEENFQSADIAACRESYREAISHLGSEMTERVVVPEAPSANVLDFEVFFDFDSDQLTDSAAAHLSIVSTIISGFKAPVVTVIGNADQSGSAEYNFDLAGRRAATVASLLEGNAVPIAGVYSFGDEMPKVELLDKAPERLNRRVLILVSEGT